MRATYYGTVLCDMARARANDKGKDPRDDQGNTVAYLEAVSWWLLVTRHCKAPAADALFLHRGKVVSRH